MCGDAGDYDFIFFPCFKIKNSTTSLGLTENYSEITFLNFPYFL